LLTNAHQLIVDLSKLIAQLLSCQFASPSCRTSCRRGSCTTLEGDGAGSGSVFASTSGVGSRSGAGAGDVELTLYLREAGRVDQYARNDRVRTVEGDVLDAKRLEEALLPGDQNWRVTNR
jgi:hypothetical protein